MRVLTVRQPWAWAIARGWKDVENRTTNLAGQYRGPVAIHAGKLWDVAADEIRAPHPIRTATDAERQVFGDDARYLTFGAILGVADLVDVHHADWCWNDDGPNDHCSVWAEEGTWHLAMRNARRLSVPLPWTGHLGLRELPSVIEAELLRRLS